MILATLDKALRLVWTKLYAFRYRKHDECFGFKFFV